MGGYIKQNLMKALHQMDNLERAYILCSLFPDEIPNILKCINDQCENFLQNEQNYREGWTQKGFFTADFWYYLVKQAYKTINIKKCRKTKLARWCADHFFDGHNSLFAVHCLIEFSQKDECNESLKTGINLFFGKDSILKIINQ